MVVSFMKNSSAEIVVKKTVSLTKQVDCALKADCSVLNPVLIVNDVKIVDFNYFQIPDFNGRYYFVERVVTRNENTLEVYGRVDVLMSFQTDILASTGVVERNENYFNKYISDSQYTVVNYERVQTLQFPNGFPDSGEYVLVVAGN